LFCRILISYNIKVMDRNTNLKSTLFKWGLEEKLQRVCTEMTQ